MKVKDQIEHLKSHVLNIHPDCDILFVGVTTQASLKSPYATIIVRLNNLFSPALVQYSMCYGYKNIDAKILAMGV